MDSELTVRFKPLEEPKGITRPIPGTKENLELIFEKPASIDLAPGREKIKQTTSDLIGNAYSYILGVMGNDFPQLSRKFAINLTDGENYHHQGILMSVPIKRIAKAVQEGSDSYYYRRENALVAHELIHNLTDDEELPMFLEMIYMLEKDGDRRVKEIGELLATSKLEKPHLNGLKKIAQWLNYQTPREMLKALPEQNIEDLKREFNKRMNEYCLAEKIK